MKVTIAIPNFNGSALLKANLPNIIASGADEILIIDDKSLDDSISVLTSEFPKVRLLENKKNLGFILTVNKLFEEATGNIVILLNNDIWVEKDFIPPLIKHFSNKNVFAVNCHEKGESWAATFWKNGFYEIKRGEDVKGCHRSAWASGGSTAVRKEIWLKLGGFDPIFHPGYWEDIDISSRALKAGYEILWEPKSLIEHHHGTTMKKVFKQKYITWVQQRNQLLFIWKNIKDPKLVREHRWNLLKRLLGGVGFGYWIPFLWAVLRSFRVKDSSAVSERSDLEVINYASEV